MHQGGVSRAKWVKRSGIVAAALLVALAGCSGKASVTHAGGGGTAGVGGAPAEAGAPAMGTALPSPIVIAAAARSSRVTTWSLNYWDWLAGSGSPTAGTESLVRALQPALVRVGGYNNDANRPEGFGHAELDAAVAYARAVGAEPLIQVPLLSDELGMPPTAATAADLVNYANVTSNYGVSYFSIGNEPDIYADQGDPADSTKPAIPGYTPEDYCASVKAYVAAMKSVDPNIKIVGPDLSWRYVPGTANDWLTPILQGCGSEFDIIAIHRYPFASAAASVPRVKADLATFEQVISSLRGIMNDTGFGDKPLAVTEMNVAYDAQPTSNVPDAGNGTVPSALWLADILGSSAKQGLWTTAFWDISDVDAWSLGLIGLPPAHTPRPAYYAYALYADYFGPTLVDVTTAPPSVRAYATRNAAGTETEVIISNWNRDARAVSLQVTDLDPAPAPAVYTLPGLSLVAVRIPDRGAPSAEVYGAPQFSAQKGPERLFPGVTVDATDAGPDDTDAALACPNERQQAPITVSGSGTAGALEFGPASDHWGSFAFAASGQSKPAPELTADGNGFSIDATLAAPAPADQKYAGYGLYYSAPTCIDATEYTGIEFDLSGDLGTCELTFAAQFTADLRTADDAIRGSCPLAVGECYPPFALVTSTGKVQVAFADMAGGFPAPLVDKTSISSFTWQLTVPESRLGLGCEASFSVENVAFY